MGIIRIKSESPTVVELPGVSSEEEFLAKVEAARVRQREIGRNYGRLKMFDTGPVRAVDCLYKEGLICCSCPKRRSNVCDVDDRDICQCAMK